MTNDQRIVKQCLLVVLGNIKEQIARWSYYRLFCGEEVRSTFKKQSIMHFKNKIILKHPKITICSYLENSTWWGTIVDGDHFFYVTGFSEVLWVFCSITCLHFLSSWTLYEHEPTLNPSTFHARLAHYHSIFDGSPSQKPCLFANAWCRMNTRHFFCKHLKIKGILFV